LYIYLTMAENNWWQQQARDKALFFALALFAAGIWLSLPLFTSGSDLTRISGKLDTAYLDIAEVSSTHERYGISNTVSSQRATLKFRLNGDQRNYAIQKNIGDNDHDAEYDQILSGLNGAKLISVWIKKKDSLDTNPDVFQIYADAAPVLPLKAVKEKDLPIVLLLFFLGAALLVLVIWARRRRK
jgi:hypothetical protein